MIILGDVARTRGRRSFARYLDALAAAGGEPPSFDEASLAHRQQMCAAIAIAPDLDGSRSPSSAWC